MVCLKSYAKIQSKIDENLKILDKNLNWNLAYNSFFSILLRFLSSSFLGIFFLLLSLVPKTKSLKAWLVIVFVFLFSREKEKKKFCFQNEKHVWLIVLKNTFFKNKIQEFCLVVVFEKAEFCFLWLIFLKKIIFILIQKHVCSKVFEILTPKEIINQLFCI